MFSTSKKILCSTAFLYTIFASASSQALYINLSDTGNAAANDSFRKAADVWEALFTDNVTINISSSFATLGGSTIGQTGASYLNTTYSFMKNALTADVKSTADGIMVAGLPKGDSYNKLMNGTSESASQHDNHTYTQTDVHNIAMTRANAKAVGLVNANDAGIDAEITFNSDFDFDFDSSDGIAAGSVEFFGAALHEIGHSLGFDSGVDVLDYYSFVYNSVISDTDYSFFTTPLDFTRCSDESKAQGADLDWTAGNTSKHFAIDGRCSKDARINNAWSTGSFQGDGQQTGHWKDHAELGIMDPTTNYGELYQVTHFDLLAFDVIGWDLKHEVAPLPEPSSLVLLGFGFVGIFLARRKKLSAYLK
ncbi:MAG: PEP-CTERM sorting domain-containing protein [Gammaproteobacteria bacterium]|nr:MAG: PEP-CTERM sorting domain-containing protein [Gammaproteobacteria bacterium]